MEREGIVRNSAASSRPESLAHEKPSTNASIWSGLPRIRREYQKLQGFGLATRSQSESKSTFLGATVLKFECQNYQIAP
jgi:hypothetical protein